MSRLSRRKFLALSGLTAAGAALGRFAYARIPPLPQLSDAAEWTGLFAADLYARLRSEAGNVFLSPFSVQTALAMTAAGARGTTAAEMFKVLRLWGDPHPALGEHIAQENRNAKAEKPAYELTVANAIWAQEGYPWRPEYLELTRKHYGAGLMPTDFGRPEEARKRINGWVEKETRDRIKDLIPEGVIDRLTRMVLTNAIYFKSAWLVPFEKAMTTDQPFTRPNDDKSVEVPLMVQQEYVPYVEADGVQVVELPYAKGELSMVVVLPRKPDGLPEVEAGLTAEKVAGWAKAAKPTETRVFLPRFTFEWRKELVPVLKAMGMTAAFDFGKADFHGMHTSDEALAITNVIHKAFVAVDEAGTEAAAATAVVVKRASAPLNGPKVFRADHPFVFLIRDNKTGATLFLGRYTGPTA